MTTPISRRSVARGAAGSIPAVTVAGAAPVMAASTCGAPTPRVSGGVIYDTGTTCRNFTTGPSGRFITNYSNVDAPPWCGVAQGGLSYVQDVTVTLSDGTTLPYQVKSLDASNKC
ncbi:hypothetical protein [Dermacoccus sp. GAS27A]|uniref:hypothetical protein n=1 Tax=Dermacoccus sp. GAS27A TaxID=3156270 RepID=UPI003838A08F